MRKEPWLAAVLGFMAGTLIGFLIPHRFSAASKGEEFTIHVLNQAAAL
jgi:uncharacterized membrane-anchored protein YhcB (DUF1043 family)